MGPLGAKVSNLESLKSPVTTKVERGLIRISSFSWLSRSAISAGISDANLLNCTDNFSVLLSRNV